MKKILSLVGASIVIFLIFYFQQANKSGPETETAVIASKSSEDSLNPSEAILEKVKLAAQKKIPNVELEGREDLTFFELSEKIDEFMALDIILTVENEFDEDITDEEIQDMIGEENRKNILHHVSLKMLADILEKKL